MTIFASSTSRAEENFAERAEKRRLMKEAGELRSRLFPAASTDESIDAINADVAEYVGHFA